MSEGGRGREGESEGGREGVGETGEKERKEERGRKMEHKLSD